MSWSLPSAAREAGYRLAAFETVGSTSAEALERGRAGERGPLWIVSEHQSAGTGRRGAAWQTPRGNLAASLLLFSTLPAATLAQLGFVAGLALRRALGATDPAGGIGMALDGARSGGDRFALKWPNDVLADGAKLAGILLQSERHETRRLVVIGIGVNVLHAPEGLPYAATSLARLGVDVSAPDLFGGLAAAWLEWVRIWDDGRGFGAVRKAWLAGAAGLGGDVAVRVGDRVLRGIFETIDEDGQLLVRSDDGSSHRVSAGDVHFGFSRSARSEVVA